MRRTRMWRLMAVGVATAVSVGAGQEKDSPDLVGDWHGAIKVAPGVELTAVVHVTREGEKLKATFDSPDQKALGFATEDVAVADGVFKFAVKSIGGAFEGKVAEDGQAIDGQWAQAGQKFPLKLEKGEAKVESAPAELKGAWEGTLKAGGGIELRLVLRVVPDEKDADRLVAVLDSPDQAVEGIPVTKISLEEKSVKFAIGSIGGSFEGKLDDKGEAIEGTWKQGPASNPLKLIKTETPSKTARNRPQNPKDPLPYKAEDVTVANQEAGVTLAGTLTLPEGDGPFPAAVLVSGSGPQDRNEELLGHKPFLVLADSLTRRGIAVLRFDDRGVGKSTGDFAKATTADFATDAVAAARYLKGRKEIDGTKIGIIGHSEGGLIAPLAAVAAPEDIAYIVMMAGPGVPGSEIIERQQSLIASAGGAGASQVEVMGKVTREVMRLVNEGADKAAIKAKVKALLDEMKEALSEEDRKAIEGADGEMDAGLEQMLSPWFKYFLTFDPRPTLAKVKCPVLAVNGEHDLQVDPDQNLPEVEKALKAGANARYKVVELPGLNHLFQPSETGAPGEYAKIETTIDPTALEAIGAWVVETVGGK